MDRAPEGAAEKAEAAIRGIPGVIDVERLRVRLVGPTHFVDASVKVPRTLPIDRLDDIKRQAQDAVDKVLRDADLTFTAIPVARDNESVRERIMVIARNSGLAIHHVTVHDLGGRLTVGIDLEVDGDMPLGAAHEVTRTLEGAIRADFGADVEVDTHIEPLEPELPQGTDPGSSGPRPSAASCHALPPSTARCMTSTTSASATARPANSLTSTAAPGPR